MNPEEEHPQIELHSVFLSHKIQDRIKADIIKNSWILLEKQSTVHVFFERRFLKDIPKIESWMYIHYNADVTSTNQVGNFPGMGHVLYHPNGIANILYLYKMSKQFRIIYDSWVGNAFELHK